MKIRKDGVKRFLLYGARWELSSVVLAPCISWFGYLGEWPAVIIANAVGACVFFFVDSCIFKEKK